MEITAYLQNKQKTVESALGLFFPKALPPFERHLESMRYSLFVGGKRIRPILCIAAAEAVSDSPDIQTTVLPICCALECIHTYSLIHDDLPAMDNDTLRRGKPTNHVVYGEAEAILAGDGLLTYAFELLSGNSLSMLPPLSQLNIIKTVSHASGSFGMVGGQALDIENENRTFPFETLCTIHKNKTGALITASVLAGAIAAECTTDQQEALIKYGDNIGLAFQIVDDLLNVTSTTEVLGKTAGSDEESGKATYPAFFGIEKTKKLAQDAVSNAIKSLDSFDDRSIPLRQLAQYIIDRPH